MNILSIDYGDVRIGLAYGSDEHKIALPLKVIQNDSLLKQSIQDIIQTYHIEHILVGIPLNFSSQDTQQTQKVRQFIHQLSQWYDGSIEEVDERLTSALAQRYISKKQSIDIESARILLEEWFTQII